MTERLKRDRIELLLSLQYQRLVNPDIYALQTVGAWSYLKRSLFTKEEIDTVQKIMMKDISKEINKGIGK